MPHHRHCDGLTECPAAELLDRPAPTARHLVVETSRSRHTSRIAPSRVRSRRTHDSESPHAHRSRAAAFDREENARRRHSPRLEPVTIAMRPIRLKQSAQSIEVIL